MNNKFLHTAAHLPYAHDEICGYLFEHYRHLMTPAERLAFMMAFQKMEATFIKTVDLAQHVPQREMKIEALALLKKGNACFYDSVKERLLRECASQIIFNRCPKCETLCRTPKACLCPNPACNHVWYETRK